MISTSAADLLQRIRIGKLDPDDTAWLEQAPADQFVEELRSSRYRVTFQERLIGKKREISLARSRRFELAMRPIPDAVFPSWILIPIYLDCLMLNIEENRFTGISRITRLTAWEVNKPERGLAIKSGRGFKLDKTIDGWEIKPLQKKIVKLSKEFLQKRGWRFDHP